KIDGKWKNLGETTDQGFGLHLGDLKKTWYDTAWLDGEIRRIDTITRTFRNYFTVSVSKNFEVKQNEIHTVKVTMDVKQWMESPFTWDFNVTGGAIMSRELAMDSLVRNRQGVFK
ncbi:MAG: hypothetical protein LBP96_01085, partial [Bacteroidales bacterium]|nr:hypothetical protein [Bacteroidales bacterium]